jgi:hypothetical protein
MKADSGFIVSKGGMIIFPERNESISKIPPIHNNKSMHSFLGNINFVIIFVPRFVEIVKPLQDMIKKDAKFKWGSEENASFEKIKENIEWALALMIPDFNKYFIIYTFAFDIAFAVFLT